MVGHSNIVYLQSYYKQSLLRFILYVKPTIQNQEEAVFRASLWEQILFHLFVNAKNREPPFVELFFFFQFRMPILIIAT